MAGWPRRCNGETCAAEESPGSTGRRCRITSGGGDPRESATESKPPRHAGARVKGCGKSAPPAWRQAGHGKPHREQNRIGMTAGRPAGGFPHRHPGRLHRGAWRHASQMNGHPSPAQAGGDRTRLTGHLVSFTFSTTWFDCLGSRLRGNVGNPKCKHVIPAKAGSQDETAGASTSCRNHSARLSGSPLSRG